MSRYAFEINLGMFTGNSFEVINVTTASTAGFTLASNTKIIRTMATVEDGSIRYRYDGGFPTPTVGHLVGSGDIIGMIGVSNLKNFMAIAVSGTANLMVSYEMDSR